VECREQKIEREGYTRYLKTITDIPSRTRLEKVERKFKFLQEVVENGIYNGLLNCGPWAFDTFNMAHNGTAWVIKLEAEVYEDGK
jgi:hypothetical protein